MYSEFKYPPKPDIVGYKRTRGKCDATTVEIASTTFRADIFSAHFAKWPTASSRQRILHSRPEYLQNVWCFKHNFSK